MKLDQYFDTEFLRKLVRMKKLYENKKIPLAIQKELMSIFFYLIDHSDFEDYAWHPEVRLLFENLFNQLDPAFSKEALRIYNKMYPLRRKLYLRQDNPYFKYFSDLLEKKFPELCLAREDKVKFIYKTILETKLSLWLEDKQEKIKQFSVSFPNLYEFFIKPLNSENCRQKPLYIFFLDYHFDGLFRAIDGDCDLLKFFEIIELTLERLLKAFELNKRHFQIKSGEIFSSCKTLYEFSGKSRSVFGEIFTAKYIFDKYGSDIKLELLHGKGCDFRFNLENIYYLIESKAKRPGYGCQGNISALNDFFKNYIFSIWDLLQYIMPEFCEEYKIQMSHFSRYDGTDYNQCVKFIPKISTHFKTVDISRHINLEQEKKIFFYTIFELYDQPIPLDLASYIPEDEEKIQINEALGKDVGYKKCWANLLKTDQLIFTQSLLNRQQSKMILHIYAPNYEKQFWTPLTSEKASTAGLEKWLETLREILNEEPLGNETELWISNNISLRTI